MLRAIQCISRITSSRLFTYLRLVLFGVMFYQMSQIETDPDKLLVIAIVVICALLTVSRTYKESLNRFKWYVLKKSKDWVSWIGASSVDRDYMISDIISNRKPFQYILNIMCLIDISSKEKTHVTRTIKHMAKNARYNDMEYRSRQGCRIIGTYSGFPKIYPIVLSFIIMTIIRPLILDLMVVFLVHMVITIGFIQYPLIVIIGAILFVIVDILLYNRTMNYLQPIDIVVSYNLVINKAVKELKAIHDSLIFVSAIPNTYAELLEARKNLANKGDDSFKKYDKVISLYDLKRDLMGSNSSSKNYSILYDMINQICDLREEGIIQFIRTTCK